MIFGATGDLTGRKLAPALFNLLIDQSLTDPTVIIGVSRNTITAAAFGEKLKPRVAEFSRQKVEPAAWDKFAGMLDYVGGEFADDTIYEKLKERLEAAEDEGHQGQSACSTCRRRRRCSR